MILSSLADNLLMQTSLFKNVRIKVQPGFYVSDISNKSDIVPHVPSIRQRLAQSSLMPSTYGNAIVCHCLERIY